MFWECFNPCYAGSKIESTDSYNWYKNLTGFNPCYAGSKIERKCQRYTCNMGYCVSILVMLEVK